MWQINRITKETLLNISKFSNKVIKIAKFVNESNQPFLINNLLNVSDQTDQIDILNAFDKDITRTANDFFEMQKLLITVDDNGFVKELENEEKNIKKIFLDKYNKEDKILSLPTLDLDLSNPISKEEIRESIIKSVLGLDRKKYKDLMKIKENLKDTNKSELINDNERIRFLTNKADIDFVKSCVDKISVFTKSFVEIRKNLNFEEKELIDSKITSGRTMVDGILSTSTYISKKEGIYQISPEHKKQYGDRAEELFDKIHKEIKESGYISGVEIDQDTDLEKFLFMIEKVKNFHLNVDMEFELKTRKLGNYMANGIYYHNDNLVEMMGYHSDIYNIISVDVNSPSSLVHELTHLIDLSNKDFFHAPERIKMISHFRPKIKIPDNIAEKMSDDYISYLNNPKEIIARLGEIGYLLNKIGYKGHNNQEELDNCFKKMKMMEMIETAGDKEIPVVHSIDFYKKNSFMYFDIENLDKEELMAIKEYYKSYYNVFEKEFTPLENSSILANLEKNKEHSKSKVNEDDEEKEVKKKNRYSKEENPISYINLDNIKSVLMYNDEEQIFKNKELATFLSKNICDINRSRLNEGYEHFAYGFNVMLKAFDYSIETNNKELQKELFNAICLKADQGYLVVNKLNDAVDFGECVDLYKVGSVRFTNIESRMLSSFKNNTIEEMQAKYLNEDKGLSKINRSSNAIEIEIERPYIMEQFKSKLSILKDFNKEDIFFHKSLIEISVLFSKYANEVGKILDSGSLLDQANKETLINEDNLSNFSGLLNANLILSNDKKLNDFKRSVNSTIDYFHKGYTKRPSFDLKFENMKEDFLLESFDKLKENMIGLTPALLKNKGLSEGATDKQKLSLLSKLSLKNFEKDFMISFVEKLELKDINKDKKIEIFKDDPRDYRYDYSKKKMLIDFVSENDIGLKSEMTMDVVKRYGEKFSLAKAENLEIDQIDLFDKSKKEVISENLELVREEAIKATEFLNSNKDTHLFLISMQKQLTKFLIDKNVLNDFSKFAKENRSNNSFDASTSKTLKIIKDLTMLTGVNIENDNAIKLIEGQQIYSSKLAI